MLNMYWGDLEGLGRKLLSHVMFVWRLFNDIHQNWSRSTAGFTYTHVSCGTHASPIAMAPRSTQIGKKPLQKSATLISPDPRWQMGHAYVILQSFWTSFISVHICWYWHVLCVSHFRASRKQNCPCNRIKLFEDHIRSQNASTLWKNTNLVSALILVAGLHKIPAY